MKQRKLLKKQKKLMLDIMRQFRIMKVYPVQLFPAMPQRLMKQCRISRIALSLLKPGQKKALKNKSKIRKTIIRL